VSPEATEFLGTIEPVLTRLLVYLAVLFVAVALVWMGFGKIDVVASASFRLAPLGQLRALQAPRDGHIEAIYVKEGDTIAEGDLIVKLKSRETQIELRDLTVARSRLERARHELEVSLPRERALMQETIAGLERRVSLTRELARAHRAAIASFIEGSSTTRPDTVGADATGTAGSLATEIRFRTAEMEHLRGRYEDARMLLERRLISRVQMEEARVRYLDALAQLPGRMSEIHRFETTIQDLKAQILRTKLDYEKRERQVRDAYREAVVTHGTCVRSVDRDLDEESDLILAPQEGVVTRVRVNSEGQVVTKGQVLASFAPSSAPLVAEALILDRDVGRVRLGQTVKLKYEAFPYVDYGVRYGKLEEISPDAEIDPVLGPVFRGTIQLEDRPFRVDGRDRPLMYGMKGTAEIVVDRESVLHLVLRPLRELGGAVSQQPGEQG
jgi:HlyD family type I secretion membrane fusion protein